MEIEELIKNIYWHLDETKGEDSKGTFDQGYEQGCDYCICLIKELEQSLLSAEQEKVEFPEHIVKYLDNCKARNTSIEVVLSDARYYNSDYAYWTEEEIRKVAVAYATGEYTVKKEPLWLIKGTDGYLISLHLKKGLSTLWTGNGDKYDSSAMRFDNLQKAEGVAALVEGETVPVEEEME